MSDRQRTEDRQTDKSKSIGLRLRRSNIINNLRGISEETNRYLGKHLYRKDRWTGAQCAQGWKKIIFDLKRGCNGNDISKIWIISDH